MGVIDDRLERACRIASESDVLCARELLRAHAQRFSKVEQTKLVTAGSELARNILKYGGPAGGHMQIELLTKGGVDGVRVVFTDQGPGIADLALAMQDGYSTGGSLGLGLPGARRLVDAFSIQTEVGRGTTVAIVKWNR